MCMSVVIVGEGPLSRRKDKVGPEAKQDHHQQETAERQPETLASKEVRDSESGHGGQGKEGPPYLRLRRWKNASSGLQIFFNFLVVVFTGALVWVSYRQLEVTRESVEVAREATEATKRAAEAAVIAAQTAQGQLKEMQSSSADTKAVADAANRQAANTEKLALAAQEQMVVSRNLAEATKSAAATAGQTLMLTHRPWVMVTHQIVEPSKPLEPLRFTESDTGDVRAWLLLNEVLENIGHSVAVDVVSWSEVIPGDPQGFQSALARRKRRCDELRHPHAKTSPGSVLFPEHKDPPAGKLLVTKDGAIRRAISLAHPQLEGHINLVVVGCISYRASFEAPDVPRHQTRFIYVLGHPEKGRLFAALKPSGKIMGIGLVPIPEATTAD
jgi:hypothetical protein